MTTKQIIVRGVAVLITVVGIQRAYADHHIPGDSSIGTWDPIDRIYTLTADVHQTIQIDQDNLTLDGAGYSVIGEVQSGSFGDYLVGYGVYLYGRTGVTIKNLTVRQFHDGIHLHSSSNNTLTDNVMLQNDFGIRLDYSDNNTLTGNIASDEYTPAGGSGILLYFSSYNTMTGNTANSNSAGILISGNHNILTDNTANSNRDQGIELQISNSSTLTGNMASDNGKFGIVLRNSSNNNTLTGNMASGNGWRMAGGTSPADGWGICLWGGSNNTLTGNKMSGNTDNANFHIIGHSYEEFDQTIDTTNLVEGQPLYYVKNAHGQVFDSSTNAGVFYAINCDNITIKDLILANNTAGLFLWNTHNSRIENVAVSGCSEGISLNSSGNNTLTGNVVSDCSYGGIVLWTGTNTLTGNMASQSLIGILLYGSNNVRGNIASENDYGIGLADSSNSTLTNNMLSDNLYGIYLYSLGGNQIYNNNFINNGTQAYLEGGSGDLFNLDEPIGGNYWSDWTSPDDDGDGFVDSPYVFTGGQDDLPWTKKDGWENHPPVADAGPDQIVYAGVDGIAQVTLDASGSTDPDSAEGTNDDIASFDWSEGTTLLGSGESIDYTFPLGKHVVTLVVTDTQGKTDEDEVIITVTGSEPSAGQLWIFPILIFRDMGDWEIMAMLRLPEGVTKAQIDMVQPLLLYPGEIEAMRQYAVQSGGCWRPRTTIFAFFNKDSLMDAVPDDGPVELLVAGKLKAGTWFAGTDTVKIVSWGPWEPCWEFLLDYDD